MDDEAMEHASATITPTTTTMRQARVTPSKCKVCGDSAEYSYYGAVVCQSCKIFFKRNAPSGQDKLKCHFNNDCGININNRHTCSACRLKMCFANGMSTDKLRGSRGKKSSDSTTTTTTLILCSNQQQSEEVLPISNLLRSDQSSLTIEQWNLLSNLVHCYDEHCGHSFVENYVREQSGLPGKSRFKCALVREFFTVMKCKIQLGIEKNRDLLSLSPQDRKILLQGTAQYTSSFGGMFMIRQHRLFDYESFYESSENIFRPNAAAFTRRVIDQFDPDHTFIKLMLAIFAFSTVNYIVYKGSTLTSQINMKEIMHIQNTYVELLWRYLLHKYNDREAVIRFSNLIRCLFLVNSAIVEANDSIQFIEMVGTVIKQTEQTLCLE